MSTTPSPRTDGQAAGLLPHHAAMLEASGIQADVIAERGYRSVTTRAELRALGFLERQCRVPALLVPVRDVHGEVATYQIRPDDPRIGRQSGKALKYETVAEGKLVLDVPKRTRAHIGTPSVSLWITEGSKKVDALVSHGLAAIGVLGVWGWRGTNDEGGKTALADLELVAWNGRLVYLVFDSDTWTKMGVYRALERLKNLLERRGATVRIVYLPCADGGAKTGVDDFLAAGRTVDDLVALVSGTLRCPPAAADSEKEYVARDDGIWWMRGAADGEVTPVQLTNFTAEITAEVVEDDGVTERKLLEISARRRAVETTFRLSASEFTSMEWPIQRIGADAWVAPGGRSMRERAHVAIQVLSGKSPVRRVYTHTGWRTVEERSVFLHAAGGLAGDGPVPAIEVSLPPQLAGIELPTPATGPRLSECWAAVKRLLAVGPDRITFPMVGFVVRTVLGPIDCAIHMEGESGVFKSELAALAQQFFGRRLNARSLPGAWSSTANALERLAHHAKDAVLVVDDFVPRGSAQDIQRAHRDAERLLRGQGNHAGRSRMAADSSLRPTFHPRGGILSTGEDVPAGQSLLARLLVLHVGKKDVDPVRLQRCQADAADAQYAEFLAAFIVWLAPRLDRYRATLAKDIATLRARATQADSHRRTPEIVANLEIGLRLLRDFVEDAGLADQAELLSLAERGWSALGVAAAAHAKQQVPTAPQERFIALLAAAIASGKAHLATRDGSAPPQSGRWGWRIEGVGANASERPQGERIGWIDGSDVFLNPEASLAAVQRIAGSEPLSVTLRTLQKRLHEAGYLASTDTARQTLTVRRMVDGLQQNVLHLRGSTFGAEPVSPPAATDTPPFDENSDEDSRSDVGFVGNVGFREGGVSYGASRAPLVPEGGHAQPLCARSISEPDKPDKPDIGEPAAGVYAEIRCRVENPHPTNPTSQSALTPCAGHPGQFEPADPGVSEGSEGSEGSKPNVMRARTCARTHAHARETWGRAQHPSDPSDPSGRARQSGACGG